MKKLLLITLVLSSSANFAADKMVDVLEASEQAIFDFRSMTSPDTVDNFNGIKAWPVSGGVKVKIYVKGSDSEEFSCHRHQENDPFECH
jgi:hypothetical protein